MDLTLDEGLEHIKGLTTYDFAKMVKTHMKDEDIDSLLIDVKDSEGTYKVDSYVKDAKRNRHIFSYWKMNGLEAMGMTTITEKEFDLLASL